MKESAETFLIRHGMSDPSFEVLSCAEQMCSEMKKGLCGEESSYPMIPTYLSSAGDIPEEQYVAVIDAGGTNFRSALVHFHEGSCVLERVRKAGMPGVEKPVTWEDFISFAADAVEDMMPVTDRIGFCFSYTAEITPEMDGRVVCIDKEVVVKGCEGQLVGRSLCAELERRGFGPKKAVVLNDTAAVQLGGLAKHQKEKYTACFGQVSGTGTNTCCTVPARLITKLKNNNRDMIVNLECGSYDGMPRGTFDLQLDAESHNPGQKSFEKMTAGVYLGELCRLALRKAGEEGLLSPVCREKISELEHVDSALADAWAEGQNLELIHADSDDSKFVHDLARSLFQRSAKLMCANLTAMAELTDAGTEGKAAVFAEGSLVQKNRIYRECLADQLEKHLCQGLDRDIDLVVEENTTLPGAAVAALLNLK